VSFNHTQFVCKNQDYDADVLKGAFYRVQFLARNNDSSGTMPTSATYYIEGNKRCIISFVLSSYLHLSTQTQATYTKCPLLL